MHSHKNLKLTYVHFECWSSVDFKDPHYCIAQIQFVSHKLGTAVAQWLRCCATNRKVAGSISVGVSGFFIDIISLRSHYGPGVDSASN